jgi:hypothetical protein
MYVCVSCAGVHMHVCMYVCISCADMYIHVSIYVYVSICIAISAFTDAGIGLYIHVIHMHACMHARRLCESPPKSQ